MRNRAPIEAVGSSETVAFEAFLGYLSKYIIPPIASAVGCEAPKGAFAFPMTPVRTYVYIDAFNLYYGALANTSYKWLDLEKLCDGMLSEKFKVERIKYFTAMVKPSKADPGQPARQQAYIKALGTLPRVEIIRGHFLVEESRLRTVAPPHARVLVEKENEKGSDVNLATHLLCDGYENAYDVAVVVTGDSDQVLPIKMVREKLGKDVGVINPQSRPSAELQKAASFYYGTIRPNFLATCQFPETMHSAKGIIFKPHAW